MAEGDTLVNALLGAVVSVVLTFLPFSPLIGGAVGGYLNKGTTSDGLRVGVYAGLIAAVPLALVSLFLSGVFLLGGFVASRVAIGFLFVFVAFGFLLAYTVGLSALGGYLGAYLANERA